MYFNNVDINKRRITKHLEKHKEGMTAYKLSNDLALAWNETRYLLLILEAEKKVNAKVVKTINGRSEKKLWTI